jgi:hypothetical protein
VRAQVLNHDVPCRHCLRSVCVQRHHDCLEKVQPDDVVRAALSLLQPPPTCSSETSATRAGTRQLQFHPQGIT